MGRTYAGILGPVSFGTVIARGLICGDAESALYAAPWALFSFAAIGYVIGSIAERTIIEAVETRFHAQLQADEAAETAAMTATHLASGKAQRA